MVRFHSPVPNRGVEARYQPMTPFELTSNNREQRGLGRCNAVPKFYQGVAQRKSPGFGYRLSEVRVLPP